MAETKVRHMKAKGSGKGKGRKVQEFHVRRMSGPKGEGFHARVQREPAPGPMMMNGGEEPEEQFHPNLKSVGKHMAEAFGPPDAGEPDADDMKPAGQDTQEA